MTELPPQRLHGVLLDQNLPVEVGRIFEAQVLVGAPGVTVDAGVGAPPVRVQAPPEGHVLDAVHDGADRRGMVNPTALRPRRRNGKAYPQRPAHASAPTVGTNTSSRQGPPFPSGSAWRRPSTGSRRRRRRHPAW